MMMRADVKPYRLLKPLLHGGIYHQPGTVLYFDSRRAQWLAEQGVISMNGIVAKERSIAPQGMPARRIGGCAGCGR